jgi:hypothetical protein
VSGLLAVLAALFAVIAPVPPTAAGRVDYQLGGIYQPAAGVQIVTRDRTERPVEGRYSICYVNAFQTQPGSASWWAAHHPELLLRSRTGKPVRDPGWPDEILLDLRTEGNRKATAAVMHGWFDRCASDGYHAVEPDNLDSWTRSRGLVHQSHAEAYARLLVAAAHEAGLAIAQKNAPELAGRHLGFDFAVAEECEVFGECDAYTRAYGRHVIEIEYTDNGRSAFRRACAARAGQHSILLRDRDVVPKGADGHVSRSC